MSATSFKPSIFRMLSVTLAALVTILSFKLTALAGPPLLCHVFEIGGAKSLPWEGQGWRPGKPDYDVNNLTADTLSLLTPEMPVIVRIETLRRATVYAMRDQRVAVELHSRLLGRARKAEAKGKANALAWFDLGLLEEIYKQARPVSESFGFAADRDGYASVVKAINMRGGDPEMEFAAAVIALHPRRDTQDAHLQKALAGAKPGSLLARNIDSHFENATKRARN